MDSYDFDLAKLAQQTIDLNNDIPSQNPFMEEDTGPEVPNGPGLVFRVDKKIGTFCVRGIPTDNIYETYVQLSYEDKGLLKKLKIGNDEDFESISFFETDSLQQASIIQANIMNKRFPYMEDMVCNISDPGFSWWLNLKECGLEVYFTSHTVGREEKLIKLGPLGDPKKAVKNFLQYKKYFEDHLNLVEFTCQDKLFSIEFKQPTAFSEQLNDIFIDGQFELNNQDFAGEREYIDLFYFLREIAFTRSFWLVIQDLIKENVHQFSNS